MRAGLPTAVLTVGDPPNIGDATGQRQKRMWRERCSIRLADDLQRAWFRRCDGRDDRGGRVALDAAGL
jgi:hypothetical protein